MRAPPLGRRARALAHGGSEMTTTARRSGSAGHASRILRLARETLTAWPTRHARAACAVAALLFAGTCAAEDSYRLEDFASVDKIDVHVHINSADTALIDEAAQSNFRLLTINVDYPDFPPLNDQRESALAHVKAHPERVAFAAAFSTKNWNDADWQQQAIRE